MGHAADRLGRAGPAVAALRRGALAALLVGVIGAGCGEPPAQGPLIGEPIFSLPLQVGVGAYDDSTMRVTLLWSADGAVDRDAWVEHGPWFAPLPPRDAELHLFDPPPLAGIGRVVAYDAADGRWHPDLPLNAVGDVALVYTPSTGYFARRLDDLCCPEALADCAPCAGEDCPPRRSLLVIEADAPVEPPCAERS